MNKMPHYNKLLLKILSCLLAVLLSVMGLTSCKPAVKPSASAEPVATEEPMQKVNDQYAQQLNENDFTYMWWPSGWQGAKRQIYIMSGSYGLAFDTIRGSVYSMGAFSQKQNETDALQQNNELIDNLPKIEMKYKVNIDGEELPFTRAEFPKGNIGTARMLESGRYVQRVDAMYLRFGDKKDLYGRLEAACFTDYIALTFDIFQQDKMLKNTVLSYSIGFDKEYTQTEFSLDNRALTIKKENGEGYTILAPVNSGTTLSCDGTTVTLTSSAMDIKRNTFLGFSAIVIPSVNASPADAAKYAARESVTASAVQITPNEGREQKVTYDAQHGYVSFNLSGMYIKTEGQHTDESLNTYDRMKFTVTNNSDQTIKIPVQFVKESPLSVTGMSPMLRDATTGEPLGLPVQIVRNWHYYNGDPNSTSYIPKNSPDRFWEGRWFHGYTLLRIPAHESVTYEYTCAYGQWGTVYSASHSQLCLAGWGSNLQQWETSAIGSFGESFCYDIARSYTGCVMGDIDPLALYSRVDGQKYNWTGNIGGVDFLDYYNALRKRVNYAGMKTFFKKTGPNITEVIYSGMTADGAIKIDVTVQMPRTNDISRVVHKLKYTFLKDVTFSRLAFYQFGADSYNYNYWTRMVVGNNDGPVSFDLAGTKVSGEFPVMGYENEWDYIGRQGMNQIEIPGDGLWMGFLGAPKGKSLGNKAISLREFKATLNGKDYTKPAISVRSTYSGVGGFGTGFELNPPKDAGKTISKDSIVEMTIDYMNFPITKAEYYGPSSSLRSIPDEDFDTWKLFYTYAMQMKTQAAASVGKVLQQAPIEVEANGENTGTVAQFTIAGGIGYVPVTITNIPIYNGWELQINNGGNWAKVDQSVNGNDYWQTYYDPMTKKYELTYNVEHNGKNDSQEYRLVKTG